MAKRNFILPFIENLYIKQHVLFSKSEMKVSLAKGLQLPGSFCHETIPLRTTPTKKLSKRSWRKGDVANSHNNLFPNFEKNFYPSDVLGLTWLSGKVFDS